MTLSHHQVARLIEHQHTTITKCTMALLPFSALNIWCLFSHILSFNKVIHRSSRWFVSTPSQGQPCASEPKKKRCPSLGSPSYLVWGEEHDGEMKTERSTNVFVYWNCPSAFLYIRSILKNSQCILWAEAAWNLFWYNSTKLNIKIISQFSFCKLLDGICQKWSNIIVVVLMA